MSLGRFASRQRERKINSVINDYESRMGGSPTGEQARIRAHSELHENMRSEYTEERNTTHPKAGRSSY